SCGDLKLAGSSPEILVRCANGRVNLRPIAGTRPRGATHEQDKALETELLEDSKEIAEHVMLVDLGRNDLGRVSEYGTVRVTDFEVIERYSHVMHIVSNVEGSLRRGKDAFDVLAACFPAGTVSGAPKIRAMEIIDALEPARRGPYAGAVVYFGFNGSMDSCIIIRTAVIKGARAYVQAGAGIVADSVPSREYEETLSKARGMMKAIEMAQAGLE
ncbi:anthranilate synthase component I family protein, partial [Candidatus Poribacteria bacterium]|nr:anthranilate synthase component I family protein [Candidatus Poribacteria bacterium]